MQLWLDSNHLSLSVRRLGCVRTSTTWAACTCPSSARRWKTCAPWSECVKFRPHWESRGAASITFTQKPTLTNDDIHSTHSYTLFLSFFNRRILFLRQQSKELDKLKNQNSYMVWGAEQRRKDWEGWIQIIIKKRNRHGQRAATSCLFSLVKQVRQAVRRQRRRLLTRWSSIILNMSFFLFPFSRNLFFQRPPHEFLAPKGETDGSPVRTLKLVDIEELRLFSNSTFFRTVNLGLCVLCWVNLFSGVFLMCSGQEKITIHSWEKSTKTKPSHDNWCDAARRRARMNSFALRASENGLCHALKCTDSMAVMLLMLFSIHYTCQWFSPSQCVFELVGFTCHEISEDLQPENTFMCFTCFVPVEGKSAFQFKFTWKLWLVMSKTLQTFQSHWKETKPTLLDLGWLLVHMRLYSFVALLAVFLFLLLFVFFFLVWLSTFCFSP